MNYNTIIRFRFVNVNMTFQDSPYKFSAYKQAGMLARILNKINVYFSIIDIQDLKILGPSKYFFHRIGAGSAALVNLISNALLWFFYPNERESLGHTIKET